MLFTTFFDGLWLQLAHTQANILISRLSLCFVNKAGLSHGFIAFRAPGKILPSRGMFLDEMRTANAVVIADKIAYLPFLKKGAISDVGLIFKEFCDIFGHIASIRGYLKPAISRRVLHHIINDANDQDKNDPCFEQPGHDLIM